MKLNTHDQTPRPKKNKTITFLFVLCAILMYSIYGLTAFACFYYAHSFAGGIFVISIPCVLTTIILIQIKDIEKAYVEIKDTEIYVVDYYCGIKKEKRILFSDITCAEIHPSYSHKVKGYRANAVGMRYLVFKKDKKYLFKILYLPETEQLFKKYLLINH